MSILTVGVGGEYQTIAAAVGASSSGDILQVQAGTYVNDFVAITHDLTLQAVGGVVNMVATEQPPNGKAILDAYANVTVTGFAFSGAQVADGNGAGIRYEGGNLTLTDDYFHDNQDGLLANPNLLGNITINDSEFAHNGTGDGSTHNLYVGDIGSLTIANSYFHDAVAGHEIKSRAETTTITNSRIQDGPSGTASYSVDLPNGGNAVIRGNVIQQGPNSQNPVIIAYGEEGNVHAGSSLVVTANTILNDLNSPSVAAVWNASSAAAIMTGNAVFGLSPAQLARGSVSISGTTTLASEPALDTTSPWNGGSTPAPAPTPIPAPAPTPIPAPTPTPAPTPAPTPQSSQPDTLVLHLSEDAYLGDAQFNVSVDGQPVGQTQTVTALHGHGQSQAFSFAGNFGPGSHTVGVTFLNDAYGGSSAMDRNLYIDSIDLDGAANPGANGALYSAGTAAFSVSPSVSSDPAPTPAPSPQPPTPQPNASDTLVLHLSEDMFQGDAQFIASVDGKGLGVAQSVTALHGAGQSQDFAFQGDFGVGPHDLAVTFLNDAYGGTPATDRNLYVNSVDLDGTHYAGATASLYSAGTAHFQVGAPPNH